ncbi:hypothetical protein BSY16_5644 (plasmid) [Sinorhizobium sp. RAC02]|nr:hypothetical protein BSY16_5644 [Sinorhizobium sp. RAC02]
MRKFCDKLHVFPAHTSPASEVYEDGATGHCGCYVLGTEVCYMSFDGSLDLLERFMRSPDTDHVISAI